MEKPRYNFIDVLRVVACFLVIVNHTNSQIFLGTVPSATWYISLTYFFICKIAVPIFIMISGYTMLDHIDSYNKIGQKLLRTILALGIFSLLYYWEQWNSGSKPNASIKDYFLSVFQTQQTNAFWYLYMYIGLLIMLPFLQKMVSNLSKRDVQVFIGLCLLITGIWPIVTRFFPMLIYNHRFDFSLFDGYIGLLMMGYYLKKYVSPTKKKLIASIIIFIASIAFNVIMTRREYTLTEGHNYLFFDNCIYLPIVLASVAFFYIVSQIKIEGRSAKIMNLLGGCSFGIYLLSDFFIRKLGWIWSDLCAKGLHPIIAVVIFESLIFVIGFIITFILKKIPVLKKIL